MGPVRHLSMLASAMLLVGVSFAQAVPPPLDLVSIRIEPLTPTVVQLGRPFTFDVVVTNTLPVPVMGKVTIEFASPQPPEEIVLEPWTGLIAGGGSVRLTRFVVSGRWLDTVGEFTAHASGEFLLQAAREIGVVAAPAAVVPVTIEPAPVALPRFQDVTQRAGITTELRTGGLCQDYAAGAAWGDVNADGRLDLFIPQRTGPSELWINEPGGFVERAAQYRVDNGNGDGTFRTGIGATFIDYDDDGWLDLFVINDGVNRLYRNGPPGFTDVAPAAGLTDDANHTSAAWGDYDGDGDVDLFVTTHGRRASCFDFFSYFQDRLYRNNGIGGFTDVSGLLPQPASSTGLGFQGSWLDYNNDGRLDIYVSNDHWSPSDSVNLLWRNDGLGGDGRWRFTDVSGSSGAGITANAMGTAIGDFNRDGFFDIAVSDLRPLSLLKNNGDGTFTNVAGSVGLIRGDESRGMRSATWGLSFEDLNGDGWEDLYVAAGQLDTDGNPTEAQPNQVFVNDGAGRFLDLSGPSGADDPAVSRDAVFADYDGDGRVDMFVMNQDGKPRLLRNVTPGFGHWLGVRVAGRDGGRAACGARLQVLVPGEPLMVRHVFCGSTGLASGSDPTIRLGLGALTQVTLTVDWPTGTSRTVANVSADQVVTVVEP